ncbi:MAG: hypothetical protein M0Z42_10945, partial [Actinomycetota bacterium]|nr:hypothetical protein [Actinomycetota bacterium]
SALRAVAAAPAPSRATEATTAIGHAVALFDTGAITPGEYTAAVTVLQLAGGKGSASPPMTTATSVPSATGTSAASGDSGGSGISGVGGKPGTSGNSGAGGKPGGNGDSGGAGRSGGHDKSGHHHSGHDSQGGGGS